MCYIAGYRLRWFRLKGNLLFYFKVDDNGDWQVNKLSALDHRGFQCNMHQKRCKLLLG